MFAVRSVEVFEVGGAYVELEETGGNDYARECVRNEADVEVVV